MNFFWRRKQRELNEEIESHLRMASQERIERGENPERAQQSAQREMGNSTLIRETTRDAWGFRWLETLLQDLRYALRMLRKSPGFTIVAVLTLALGIGANTAIFGIVNSLLFRPLPVENPDQLAVLAFRQGNGPLLTPFSIPDYRDIRAQTTGAFSDVFGFEISLDGLSVNNKAERVLTSYVTGNFFSALGLKPYLGRLILPSEGETPGADPVVVLSYRFWNNHLGADRSVIGKRILVNGRPSVVIGIAPESFNGLYPAPGIQAYLPLGMLSTYESGWPKDFMEKRILQNVNLLGRLRPGVTLANAAAELNVVAHRLAAQYPETDRGLQLSAYSERFARPDPAHAPALIAVAGLFLALVALVLLLACANIANLLLVRASARQREMAVRAALGAPRGRLIRQMLTESILLALLGGIAGVLLGMWGAETLASINLHQPIDVPLYSGFDWRVFTYAFAAALLTGIFVGLVPALRVSRRGVSAALHESGRSIAGGKNRLRSSLVVLQVAGSLMLLVVAGLFTRSLAAVQHTNLGFDPHGAVTLIMDPSEVGYTKEQGQMFYKSLLRRVRSLPGVASAALTSNPPLSNYGSNDYIKVSGYQNPPGQALPLLFYGVISPDFFHAMHIGMISGRSFTDADVEGSQYVAIVNQAFVKRYWPHENPIGQHFAKTSGATNPTYTVIGVTEDSRLLGLTGNVQPYFYLPLAQDYSLSSLQALEIRSSGSPGTIIREAESAIHSLAPDIPIFEAETMEESLDTFSGFLLFQLGAGLAAALGVLGLILAMVGVYGVISYSTAQRTHEIGIRMALGAQRLQILVLILRQGAVIVGAGLVAGCIAAALVSRLMASFLVGVSPFDPLTYLTVVAMLAVIALLACYVPARRAMKVDPMVALRYE